MLGWQKRYLTHIPRVRPLLLMDAITIGWLEPPAGGRARDGPRNEHAHLPTTHDSLPYDSSASTAICLPRPSALRPTQHRTRRTRTPPSAYDRPAKAHPTARHNRGNPRRGTTEKRSICYLQPRLICCPQKGEHAPSRDAFVLPVLDGPPGLARSKNNNFFFGVGDAGQPGARHMCCVRGEIHTKTPHASCANCPTSSRRRSTISNAARPHSNRSRGGEGLSNVDSVLWHP